MNVYLTEPAERYLKDIFLYYRFRASETVAQKIIDRILKRIESLEKLAMRGRIEPYLKVLKQNHRYVLTGNYKIIYRIENDEV